MQSPIQFVPSFRFWILADTRRSVLKAGQSTSQPKEVEVLKCVLVILSSLQCHCARHSRMFCIFVFQGNSTDLFKPFKILKSRRICFFWFALWLYSFHHCSVLAFQIYSIKTWYLLQSKTNQLHFHPQTYHKIDNHSPSVVSKCVNLRFFMCQKTPHITHFMVEVHSCLQKTTWKRMEEEDDNSCLRNQVWREGNEEKRKRQEGGGSEIKKGTRKLRFTQLWHVMPSHTEGSVDQFLPFRQSDGAWSMV